jgi:hypothetical protein
MNKKQIAWRCLIIALTLSMAAIAKSQTLSFTAAPNQTGQSDAARVEQLLRQSGYTYRKISDSAWVSERQGKNLSKFTVIFASGPGFLVTGVVVARKTTMNVTSEMMFKLLKLDHSMDYVKIGFDDDDDLFVRSEVKTRQLDLQEFKEGVERVSDDANEIYAAIKPYLKTP